MKKGILSLFAIATVMTTQTVSAQGTPFEGLDTSAKGYIELNGYGKTEVTPDKIYISFQIDENDTKGRKSVEDQEREMIAALTRLGIDVQKDLTVSDISSNFKKYILRRNDIQQSRDYQLIVPSAQVASSVFAALEGAGISNATISKAEYAAIEEVKLQTKVEATKNAQEKARALAGAVGQTIGKAIYIQDMERTYRPYATNVLMAKGMSADMATDDAAAVNLEFEKIVVESNVTVRFLLE